MREIIERRYQSSEHFDYPEMERLIDQVIEHPECEFTIPSRFLVKRHNNSDFLEILVHKITVFVRSIWLNLKKAFSEEYRKRFKLAVKKIIKAYEVANKVKKATEEVVTAEPRTEEPKNEEETVRQKEVESSIKEQIETQQEGAEKAASDTSKDTEEPVIHESQAEKNVEVKPSESTEEKNDDVISDTRSSPPLTRHKVGSKKTKKIVKQEKSEPAPRIPTNYETMCSSIKEKTGKENLQNLWKTLFDNVKDINERIKMWDCAGNQFTLTLKKPLHLWINTDRVGGCIFSFGNNDSYTITGTLKKNEIVFQAGFTSYCVHNIWLTYKRVEPTMHNIKYNNKSKVEITGSYWGKSSTHEASYSDILTEWSKRVAVVPDGYKGGYKGFLEHKFEQQK